nr:ADP/ATP carrier protein [Polyrhizophydium stewartii]
MAREGPAFLIAVAFAVVYLPVSSYIYIFDPWLRPLTPAGAALLLVWAVLLAMTVVNYTLCFSTKPGEVERDWAESDELLGKRVDWMRCNRCILRMDHHCPWVYNCIGYHNQGHFARLIIGTAMLTAMSLGMIFARLASLVMSLQVDDLPDPQVNEAAIIVTGINVTVLVPLASIMCMLAYNQTKLLLRNVTTIEDLDLQDDILMGVGSHNPYDLGWVENVKAVLGPRPLLWWMPQKMEGDGYRFRLTPLGDATAGTIGSVFANVLVFPLDVIKTRMQVQSKALKAVQATQHYNSALDALIKIYHHEGIQGLYSGMTAGLFGTVVSSFSYFYIYGTIRGAYLKRIGNAEITTAMELILGALAGALCQFIVLPIAVVTTRYVPPVRHPRKMTAPVCAFARTLTRPARSQQTDHESKGHSFMEVLKRVVHEDGPQGLWKGLRASLVLCSNPAITYGVFERLKAILLKRQEGKPAPLTAGQVFLIGALSKTLATVVTYPYIMAKVRMQWRPPKNIDELSDEDREALQYKSSLDILRKVRKSDGFRGWYKGMSTQILKAVLCQAILFVSKEKLAEYTLLLFSLFEANRNGVIQAAQASA